MFYPSSENKGVISFNGYREADLRLCFRICKNPVFSRRGSNISYVEGGIINFRNGITIRTIQVHWLICAFDVRMCQKQTFL